MTDAEEIISPFWDALKQECCAGNPAEALRCVMVGEDNFHRAFEAALTAAGQMIFTKQQAIDYVLGLPAEDFAVLAPASGGPLTLLDLPPGPFNFLTTALPGEHEGTGHVYLIDENQRKIASLWGRKEEKIALADLIIEAERALRCLKKETGA